MSLRLCVFLFTVSVSALLTVSLAPAQEIPQTSPNAIPQRTIALIQLTYLIDTLSAKAGDYFHARLAEPLLAANGATIADGKKLEAT